MLFGSLTLSDNWTENNEDPEWFDSCLKTPEDKQHCELVMEFSYLATYLTEVRDLITVYGFEGIYNKEQTNWSIVKGTLPDIFIDGRVSKWRPILKEEK